MTTTGTDALTGRIIQAMREEDGDVQHGPDAHPGYYEYAAAVLPIMAEEVARALRAEAHALMEDMDEGPVTEKDIAHALVRHRLITRAIKYETGGSDDH